jgi:hypothetical protein
MKKKLASIIWNYSELLNIPLGKYAPIVFGIMIETKPNKIQEHETT